MAGKLVIVPTPIGNLADMPPRALDALRCADAICAEDTRVSGKLLAAFGIEGKRLERLDENVVAVRAAEIIDRVEHGEAIAYCTDAGMPGVSDPGLRLVAAARKADVPVEVLPGPTAAVTAYVASGTTCPAFYFGGFFPRKDAARRQLLGQLKPLDAALVFYESPNRIADALSVVAQVFPHREVCVARELTKLHEEVVRGNALDVHRQFAARSSVKGEIVLVIDPPAEAELADDTGRAEADARVRASELFAQGERPKAIAKELAASCGLSRNDAYDLALRVAQELTAPDEALPSGEGGV